jgi:hypothetical protein
MTTRGSPAIPLLLVTWQLTHDPNSKRHPEKQRRKASKALGERNPSFVMVIG